MLFSQGNLRYPAGGYSAIGAGTRSTISFVTDFGGMIVIVLRAFMIGLAVARFVVKYMILIVLGYASSLFPS